MDIEGWKIGVTQFIHISFWRISLIISLLQDHSHYFAFKIKNLELNNLCNKMYIKYCKKIPEFLRFKQKYHNSLQISIKILQKIVIFSKWLLRWFLEEFYF